MNSHVIVNESADRQRLATLLPFRLALLACCWLLGAPQMQAVGQAAATKILPDASGLFGESLALDGNMLVVGAETHTHPGQGRGAAYVYEFVAGQWTLSAELFSPDGQLAGHFGREVAIDGSTIIVGDPNYSFPAPTGSVRSSGAAYVFQKSTSGWAPLDKITEDSPRVDCGFGHSIALAGQTAMIYGAGASKCSNPTAATGRCRRP